MLFCTKTAEVLPLRAGREGGASPRAGGLHQVCSRSLGGTAELHGSFQRSGALTMVYKDMYVYIYIWYPPPPSDLPFVVVLSTFSKGSAPKITKFHKIKVFQNTTAYVTVSILKIPKLNTPSPKSKNSENSKNSKKSKTKHPISQFQTFQNIQN